MTNIKPRIKLNETHGKYTGLEPMVHFGKKINPYLSKHHLDLKGNAKSKALDRMKLKTKHIVSKAERRGSQDIKDYL